MRGVRSCSLRFGDRNSRNALPPRSLSASRSVVRTSLPCSSPTSPLTIDSTWWKAFEP